VVRPRREKKLVQTGLRLEAEILDRLRSGKLGLSDEIRDRLERTFREDGLDPVTRELCAIITELAGQLGHDYGRPWHQSLNTFRAFNVALGAVLGEFVPDAVPGEPEPPMQPESVGHLRVQDMRRWHSYPHLEAAAKRKAERLARASTHTARGGGLHTSIKKENDG
jgi:hypothetical protein